MSFTFIKILIWSYKLQQDAQMKNGWKTMLGHKYIILIHVYTYIEGFTNTLHLGKETF